MVDFVTVQMYWILFSMSVKEYQQQILTSELDNLTEQLAVLQNEMKKKTEGVNVSKEATSCRGEKG